MNDTLGVDPAAVRTDLTFVRAVVDDLDRGHSAYAAAKLHGLSWRSVYRWQDITRRHPGWPTADDIATQANHQAKHGTRLRTRRRNEYVYRSRVAREGKQRIPATGTARRIRALVAIGWTQAEIADRLEVSGQRVSHLSTERYPTVLRDVAARVAAIYDDMCMTVPQDDPEARRPRAALIRARQRRNAAANGWAPPLAWDEDTIDDPDAEPAGWLDSTSESPVTRRAAVLEDLLGRGADLWEVLRVLEVTRNAFATWCSRYGYGDTYRRLSDAANAATNWGGNQHSDEGAAA